MPNAPFCPRCGQANTKGDPFCTRCGENLTGLLTTAAPPPATGPPPTAVPPPTGLPSTAAPPPFAYGAPVYPYPPYVYAPPPIRRATAVSMVSATFHAWGQDAAAYIGLYLAYGVITASISLGLTYALLGFALPTATFTTTPPSVSLGLLALFVLVIILVAVLNAVVAAFFTASVTYFAICKRRGTPVSWSAAFRVGSQRFLSVLGGGLLLGLLTAGALGLPLLAVFAGLATRSPALLIGGGLALLVAIPVVIFLSIALSLFAPAAMMEGVSAVESLSRSWSLTRGHRWSIFGATILVGLVSAVVGFAATLPATVSGSLLVAVAAQIVATMVVGSWAILLAAMAYELISEDRRVWGHPPGTARLSAGGP